MNQTDRLSDAPRPDPPVDPLVTARLSDEQLELLGKRGAAEETHRGQVLFHEGDRSYDFIVILAGTVNVVDHQAGAERVLATGGAGDFVAELSILTGERLFTTAVVEEPGSILVVPVDELQLAIGEDQALGDLLVQTLFRRRQWLARERAGMRIVGPRASRDTNRLRQFATRNRLAHVWLDVDTDPAATAVLERHQLTADDTPIVVMRGGELLRNPTNDELAQAAGIRHHPAPSVTYDVAVVGAGPAGMAASVYGASEGLAVLTVDGVGVGGQIGTTSRIENYLGFPVGVTGEEFAERALIQVRRFGATLVVPATAIALRAEGEMFVLELDDGGRVSSRSVIIASGVTYRRLDARGLDRFEGAGIFYTPLTPHDEIEPGAPVVIVGGGNSAGQAATALAADDHDVNVVVRGHHLAETMSKYLIDRVNDDPRITVRVDSEVREVHGGSRLETVDVEDRSTGTRRTLPAAALYVLIGAEPRTDWLPPSIELDPHGFVRTGPALDVDLRDRPPWDRLGRDPYLMETSLPGVFAAGDVRSDSVKRVAAGVGEGSITIRFVSEYLAHR
jgi:thioredoxin reductase (NADPH)